MTVVDITFRAEWTRWHDRHEARRSDPHGFLAITGLHWLSATPQRFPDAPGEWSTGPEGVVLTLADNEQVTVGGETIRDRYAFGVIPEREGVDVRWRDAVIEVAKRGGHDIVRPRHPGHATRLAYRGTPAYPPQPRWTVTGRYLPFPAPRPTTVGAAVEGLRHVYEAPGRIEFTVDDQPLRLTAFNGHEPGSLFVLFTDATSGITTYPANRSLHIDRPAPDGTVVLDFNRATNLPCAYTEFATCPLPPAENRLPVAIEAGEKDPR
jgi:uncharacterized protein (DUF1684 family)